MVFECPINYKNKLKESKPVIDYYKLEIDTISKLPIKKSISVNFFDLINPKELFNYNITDELYSIFINQYQLLNISVDLNYLPKPILEPKHNPDKPDKPIETSWCYLIEQFIKDYFRSYVYIINNNNKCDYKLEDIYQKDKFNSYFQKLTENYIYGVYDFSNKETDYYKYYSNVAKIINFMSSLIYNINILDDNNDLNLLKKILERNTLNNTENENIFIEENGFIKYKDDSDLPNNIIKINQILNILSIMLFFVQNYETYAIVYLSKYVLFNYMIPVSLSIKKIIIDNNKNIISIIAPIYVQATNSFYIHIGYYTKFCKFDINKIDVGFKKDYNIHFNFFQYNDLLRKDIENRHNYKIKNNTELNTGLVNMLYSIIKNNNNNYFDLKSTENIKNIRDIIVSLKKLKIDNHFYNNNIFIILNNTQIRDFLIKLYELDEKTNITIYFFYKYAIKKYSIKIINIDDKKIKECYMDENIDNPALNMLFKYIINNINTNVVITLYNNYNYNDDKKIEYIINNLNKYIYYNYILKNIKIIIANDSPSIQIKKKIEYLYYCLIQKYYKIYFDDVYGLAVKYPIPDYEEQITYVREEINKIRRDIQLQNNTLPSTHITTDTNGRVMNAGYKKTKQIKQTNKKTKQIKKKNTKLLTKKNL
jgi:hypothetical protein